MEGFNWAEKFRRATGIRVVQVFDKEADIADLFNHALPRHLHFIANARTDRAVQGTTQRLFGRLRQLPVKGVVKRPILDSKGKEHRVNCEIRFEKLQLEGIVAPLNAIHLLQVEPIERQAVAEWVLLTNLPVKEMDAAIEVIDAYAHRWRTCEDFHKCLKTGCSIEERQLGSAQALLNAIAMLSLVALALLRARHLAQHRAQAPATEVLTPEEYEVALLADQQFLMPIDRTLCKQGSVLWLVLLLGRMGGHQGFKQAGMPGWQSI